MKQIIVNGVDVSGCEHFKLGENGSSKICNNNYCKDKRCAYNSCVYKMWQYEKIQPNFYKKLYEDSTAIYKTLSEKYEDLYSEINQFYTESDTCKISSNACKLINIYLDKLINNKKLFDTCTGVCEKKQENTKLSCAGCIALKIKEIVERELNEQK